MTSQCTLLLLLLCLSLSLCVEADSVDSDWQHLSFTQRLDHFNATEHRTFQQRYFRYDRWSSGDPSSPIFLYISGEAPWSAPDDAVIERYAKHFRVPVLMVEHRYYGESAVFEQHTADNLRYLKVEQALEDLAAVLRREAPSRKVVVFGCSYSGALSAFFRLKYPDLVVGAISSSGVVHSIIEFTQFDKQVATSVGPECAAKLRAATQSIEKTLAGSGAHELKKRLNVLDFVDNRDILMLLADAAAETVQYGFQEKLCNAMNGANDPADNFIDFTLSFFYPVYLGNDPSSYSRIALRNTSYANGARTWTWQKCSQVGWFQTAPQHDSIRSTQLTLDYWRELCSYVFAPGLWPDDSINKEFGGADIKTTDCYYLNSSQDPWQWAGHTNSTPAQPATIVKCTNCGHCTDFRGCPSLPPNVPITGCNNMENVWDARNTTIKLISSWIEE